MGLFKTMKTKDIVGVFTVKQISLEMKIYLMSLSQKGSQTKSGFNILFIFYLVSRLSPRSYSDRRPNDVSTKNIIKV